MSEKKTKCVMLRSGHGAPFQRSEFKVDKKTGRRVRGKKVLRFEPGVPVELNKHELRVIEHELEVGLIYEVYTDERGRYRPIAEQPDRPKQEPESEKKQEPESEKKNEPTGKTDSENKPDVVPFKKEPEEHPGESSPDKAA